MFVLWVFFVFAYVMISHSVYSTKNYLDKAENEKMKNFVVILVKFVCVCLFEGDEAKKPTTPN